MTDLDKAIVESLVKRYGKAVLNRALNNPTLRKGAVAAAVIGGMAGIQAYQTHRLEMEHARYNQADLDIEGYDEYIPSDTITDDLFTKKVEAVKRTFDRKIKVVHRNMSSDDIKLDPENIVRMCDDYDFDLPGLLAQAWKESMFGTSPLARKTNSVFSLGLTDDGVMSWGYYDTQDESVEAYIKLICIDYLFRDPSKYTDKPTKAEKYTKDLKERSFTDLLEDGQFVNYYGGVYATDTTGYERALRLIRNEIIRNEPILDVKSDTYIPDEW